MDVLGGLQVWLGACVVLRPLHADLTSLLVLMILVAVGCGYDWAVELTAGSTVLRTADCLYYGGHSDDDDAVCGLPLLLLLSRCPADAS